MDLEYPADQLIHRCKYEIVIEDKVFNNHTNQTFHYEIPGECFVEKKHKQKITVLPFHFMLSIIGWLPFYSE